MTQIERILKGDWYKAASREDMRIALMRVEMDAMNALRNHLNEECKKKREECFESCAKDNGWD